MNRLNDSTLTLWLALHHAVQADDERLAELAMEQMNHPEVEVNGCFQGKSLLTLAASRQVWGQPLVLPKPFEKLPHHHMALELLERGANPWLPVHPQDSAGVDAFMAALRTNAWPLVRAFLSHPARPAWTMLWEHSGPTLGDEIFRHMRQSPLLLHEMVAQGMDPNIRVHGVPLLFLLPTIEQAEWLVSQGADPGVRADDGSNLVGYRKQRNSLAPANEGERVRWTSLMGREQVDPVQVFMEGVRGVMSKLRPLFEKPAQMREWRWDLEGGRPVNLVDACAWGAIAGHPSASSSLRSLVKHCPDAVSQDLAWLSQLRHQPSEGTPPEKVDQERLIRATQGWLDLDRRLAPHGPAVAGGHSGEGFAAWVALASDSATRDALLDLWVEWHQVSVQRWSLRPSFLSALSPRLSEDQEASWLPRHRLILTVHRLRRAMEEASNSKTNFMLPRPQREAQYELEKGKAIEHVDVLVRTKHEAGPTFPESMWMHVRAMATGVPDLGEEIARRIIVREREFQAQLQPPLPPSARARQRS